MENGVIHCKQTNTITLYNIIIMKRLLLLISLLCALCAQAQTYWNGTADKNFPGEGTEASPYLISTPEQLAGLAERTNVDKEDFAGKYIKLTQDIYLTDLSQEGETRKQWTPIGDVFYGNYSIDPESGEIISPERQEALFCGHFDGDGHTIYNLYYVPVDDWGGENFDPYVDELTDVDFSSYNKALFGNIAGGSVKNLTINNAQIAGIGYVALLACNVKQGSTISNCNVQGQLYSLSASMGAFAGENEGLIEHCSANVELTQGRIGGFVHTNQETGVIRDCSVSGKAYSTSGDIGGFVHINLGLIERCSASVDIQALYGKLQGATGTGAYRGRWAGGFVMSNMYAVEDGRISHQGVIRECYATGSLQSNNGGKLGGFGIWNYGLIESCYTTSQMSLADTDDGARTYMSLFLQENGSYFRDEALPGDCINCFAASTFVLPDADRYACAPFTEQFNHSWEDEATGFVYSREIGCYWNKDAFTTTGVGHSVAYLGTEKTLSYMKSQAFVDDLNRMAALCGTSTWEYRSGDVPRTTGVKAANLTDYLGGGVGTQANPYLINNKEQLANIGWYVDHGYSFKNQYLKQTADIALNLPMENWGKEMPTEWQPIGGTHHFDNEMVVDVDYPFSGNYDGDFHEVQNMYIDNVLKAQGLFGIIADGCTFRNLGVTGAYVRAGGCGLIVGIGGEDNCFIQCWTSGDVEYVGTEYGHFASIAGELSGRSFILNCSSSARVAGPVDHTSSLANTPRNWGDTYVNCIFTGDVPWAKNWTGYSSAAMSGGQYNENVFCNDDIMHYDNTDEFSFDSKTTAWLQSKECANVLNDAVIRWNAAHDESLQLNYWQWQEGQYPHLSAAADYQPSVKITFVSNGGTDVISKVLEEGSSVTAPRRPTRDGYYFAGWYKDEALTKFFDWKNTVLTESQTLYAKWIEDHSNDIDVTPFNNKFTKVYHIKTAAQLRGLAQVVNGKWDWSNFDKEHPDFTNYEPTLLVAPRTLEGCTVILDNDLVLNDITDWQHWGHDGYAEPWRPIGVIDWLGSQSRTSFQGTFDGQGHTISGMYIEMSAVKVYDPQRYYWGLFSELGEKAVIKNLGIEASVINGKKYDDVEHYIGQRMDAVGLLAGYAFGSSFEQCYAVGRIIEDGLYQNMCKNIGGLIGIGDDWGDYSVSISDCFARVDMEADQSSKNYTTGFGLMGKYEPRGTITNCYSGGNSYRGLSSRSSSMTVKGSYYDKELVVVENGTGTAKTTAEMKTKATYEGWDFETVWGISAAINDGYPFLRQFHPDFKEDAVLTSAPAAIADLVYTGEPQVLITAGTAEGGEVQYALSTDGEFSTALPTATNAGDYTIYYKVVADDSHNSLPVAGPINVTIAKAIMTITAGSYTKKQYDPMPEFAVSYEGFVNNETAEVLTKQPVLSCEANEDSAPGEYDITLSGAEAANYDIMYVAGKLTVTEPESYTLTYMVDGEVYQSFTVKYKEAITPLEAPTKEGYTFSGWDGLPRSMPAKDVIVKGYFTINSYTITYVLDGEVYTTETLEYGAEIVPPVIPGLEDYTIWEDVPATMPASDIKIYGNAKDIIDGLTSVFSKGEGEVYDSNGRKLPSLQKGLNIIRMKDGTVKKIIFK